MFLGSGYAMCPVLAGSKKCWGWERNLTPTFFIGPFFAVHGKQRNEKKAIPEQRYVLRITGRAPRNTSCKAGALADSGRTKGGSFLF